MRHHKVLHDERQKKIQKHKTAAQYKCKKEQKIACQVSDVKNRIDATEVHKQGNRSDLVHVDYG